MGLLHMIHGLKVRISEWAVNKQIYAIFGQPLQPNRATTPLEQYLFYVPHQNFTETKPCILYTKI
jgi:hypothetical protein